MAATEPGGGSAEPWQIKAEAIRKRDGKECLRCGLAQSEHPTKLHVHHLTPREEAPAEKRHDDRNLVTLCRSCHRTMESDAASVEWQLSELGFDSRADIPRLARLPDDLREPVDSAILDLLDEGRVTPRYVRERLDRDGVDDYSRSYVQQRLARLKEHSHVRNLLGCGLYELTDDPRETDAE
jgi:ferredoxin